MLSGVPYFSNASLFIPLFGLMLSVYIIRGIKLKYEILYILLGLTVVIIIQTVNFNFFSLPNIVGVYLRILIAYLLVTLLGRKFIPYYINVIYVISVISLLFYFPIIFSSGIKNMLLALSGAFDGLNLSGYNEKTIIIYNINLYHLDEFRNSGPFWEPGAFAGYLTLALVFLVVRNDVRDKKRAFVILFSILTTFSTTAFLAVFVLGFFVFYRRIKNPMYKAFAIFLAVGFSFFAFYQFDFLGAKIQSQIERATSGKDPYLEDTNTQRFLSILRDMQDFKGHELFGRGAHPLTRYAYQMPERQIRTVGLTDILVRVGILFFLIIMVYIYKSMSRIVDYYDTHVGIMGLGIFLTILVLLMSETYFVFPFFWCLMFLKLVHNKPNFKLERK